MLIDLDSGCDLWIDILIHILDLEKIGLWFVGELMIGELESLLSVYEWWDLCIGLIELYL
jgi:hypothetical protein